MSRSGTVALSVIADAVTLLSWVMNDIRVEVVDKRSASRAASSMATLRERHGVRGVTRTRTATRTEFLQRVACPCSETVLGGYIGKERIDHRL